MSTSLFSKKGEREVASYMSSSLSPFFDKRLVDVKSCV